MRDQETSNREAELTAPTAVGPGTGLGDGLCPHCGKPVVLNPWHPCFVVCCNNPNCSVRPRTWTMTTPEQA
jgi:hypothetical protein